MGEVYGARDSRLDRDVAIKILPDAFAQDADRLARFDREARLLASLNHPHIAILHEIEAAGGVRYLVMELVPGETLAERIRRRPLSVEDALPLFQQLAGALEAAHDRGIIHRDLKPANIKVTPDSQVKVLDFGLATTLVAPGAPADASQSPTFICDVSGIGVGVVQGTAPYMSPEQARGLPVDRRTDIWAFGCVFFEALTGRPAFNGSTITDVLADVTKGEPDWTAIGEHVPARIRELLHRCLRKDKERRLQSIADARIEIEDAIAEIGAGERPAAPSRGIRLRPVYALVAVLLAFAFTAAGFWYMKPLPSAPSTRAAIEVPPGTLGTRSGLAFSPDGRSIVYGGDVAATKGLYFRDMGASKADLIPGTEGALHPFFAPDGRSIGFFAAGKIKRMAVPGGVPQDICDVQIDGYSSASWGTDDNIVFTQDRRSSLWRVSASGGAPQLLAEPDAARNERSYLFPESLPGGKAILYAARTDSGYTIGVFVPATGERRTVIEGGRDPHYASTGHMTFWQDFSIRAAPFDLSRLAVTGPAVTVIPDVSSFGGYGASYSLSASGHLAYFPAFEDKRVRTLVWVDRNGSATPLTESRQDGYVLPRLSPDGRRVLVRFEGTADCYLNTYDIARGSWNRLTYLGDSHAAVWSPDGARVAFQSDRAGGNSMLLIPVDGGTEETLYVTRHPTVPASWSPDGKLLAFAELHPGTGWDIDVLPISGVHKPETFLHTRFAEREPMFAPDGQWIAYTSNESGRNEVYVRPFPGPGAKYAISVGGGDTPRWARSGRELFYRNERALMAVSIDTTHGFAAGKPLTLFEGDYHFEGGFDVSADGQRFLLLRAKETPASSQIQVVFNWFDELKRRVANRR